MKALFFPGEGAMQYQRLAYAKALSAIGVQCSIWNPKSGKAAFDIFEEVEPDLLFCGSWEIDRAIAKNLMVRPHIKVFLVGGNWGDFDKEIDIKVDPILMVSEAEKNYLPAIIKNNNITHILSHYPQRWTNVTHNKWKELGLEPLGLPLAADLLTYQPAPPLPSLQCDLSFVGGYWAYKATNLNKYLVPLCHKDAGIKVKLFGWGNWPVAQHLGALDDAYIPTLFASSTINANIFEPQTGKYGFDGNERGYKIMACGGFCLSEYIESAAVDLFTDNEMVFAKTPEEFKEKALYYIKNPNERIPFIKRGFVSVRRKHNYFLRLRELLTKTQYIPESEQLLTKLNKIIEDVQRD